MVVMDVRCLRSGVIVNDFRHCQLGKLGILTVVGPVVELFLRRLSDQDLVELLKDPFCVEFGFPLKYMGSARRAVLDQLGIHYQRAFADQWEFVRFAEEQKLGLDFTTPPKRP